MSGFSILIVLFYAHPSVQFGGDNAQRFSKLGAFLRSVKLPWLVAGDFNIDVNVVARSDFCKRVGGVIRRADVESGGQEIRTSISSWLQNVVSRTSRTSVQL